MRRPTTMLASAASAALAALAVTVAAPAIGDDGPSTDTGGKPAAPDRGDVRVCLVRHGAPVGAGDDPAEVKRWVVEHSQDASGRDVVKACGIGVPGDPPPDLCKPGEPNEAPDTEAQPATPVKPEN